jgi:hypothetical protein
MKQVLIFLFGLLPLVSLSQNANKGFFNVTEASYLCGFGDILKQKDIPAGIEIGAKNENNTNGIGVYTTLGYYVSSHLSTGVGIGIQGHDYPSTLPAYLDCRGYLYDKATTPFAVFGLGSFLKGSGRNEGNFFRIGAGYRLKLGKRTGFVSSLSYNRAKIREGAYYVSGDATNPRFNYLDMHYNNVALSVGVEF